MNPTFQQKPATLPKISVFISCLVFLTIYCSQLAPTKKDDNATALVALLAGGIAATAATTTAATLTGITYTGSPYTFTNSTAIATQTPTFIPATATPTSCSASPALPSGLVLAPTTCEISGTPTTNQLATTHTITATNSNGSVTTTINITVALAGIVTTFAGTAGTSGTTDGTGTAARFNTPSDIDIDASGNLYVVDYLNHTIRKITSAGVVTTFAGSAGTSGTTDGTGTAARFNRPTGIKIDSNGNLFVADTLNHTIRKITSAGVVTTFAGTAGTSGTTDGTGTAARFNSPSGIEIDASGNLFITDYANDTIRKITSSGVVTTFAGSAGTSGSTDGTGTAARFNRPSGIEIDSSGNIFVTDTSNHTIRKITSAGVVSTFAGTAGSSGTADGTGSAARFNSPSDIELDANGNLYVADLQNHAIRKITSAGVVSTFAGTAGSSGTTDGTGSAARFNTPLGIKIDANGNVFVADSVNHTIRKIQ